MCARASIENLAWESAFFNLSTARLSFADAAATLPDDRLLNQYQLLQAKVPAQQSAVIDLLSRSGFQLVEGEVELTLIMAHQAPFQAGNTFACRIADQRDITALRDVAGSVFQRSRFRAPWYQPTDSARFYAHWVEKAVLGTFDDVCLIVQDAAGQPQGFVTLRAVDKEQARIGLLAVWPGNEGQGVGVELMKVAKRWCATQGMSRLLVATQLSNLSALRLYIRSGATVNATAYWFYR